MTREEQLEPIIQSIRKGTAWSRPELLKMFSDWDVHTHPCGAVAIVKGTEIHFAMPQGQRLPARRNDIRNFLAPLMDRLGFLTTRIQHHHVREKRFVERLGFERTWMDGEFAFYMLTALPFERKTACTSTT